MTLRNGVLRLAQWGGSPVFVLGKSFVRQSTVFGAAPRRGPSISAREASRRESNRLYAYLQLLNPRDPDYFVWALDYFCRDRDGFSCPVPSSMSALPLLPPSYVPLGWLAECNASLLAGVFAAPGVVGGPSPSMLKRAEAALALWPFSTDRCSYDFSMHSVADYFDDAALPDVEEPFVPVMKVAECVSALLRVRLLTCALLYGSGRCGWGVFLHAHRWAFGDVCLDGERQPSVSWGSGPADVFDNTLSMLRALPWLSDQDPGICGTDYSDEECRRGFCLAAATAAFNAKMAEVRPGLTWAGNEPRVVDEASCALPRWYKFCADEFAAGRLGVCGKCSDLHIGSNAGRYYCPVKCTK